MKHIIIYLIALVITVSDTVLCYAEKNDNLKFSSENVKEIYLHHSSGQGTPMIIDEEYKKNHFDFQTYSENEIEYIIHYLNSFSLIDDGITTGGSDVKATDITIKYNDDNTDKSGFVSGRFYDSDGKQYSAAKNEYDRFLDFVYALKSEKLVLNNEVTFEPSQWAKSDIKKAIDNNLVPEWNRIDYINNITRVEVCQLIDNFLTVKGYSYDTIPKNAFKDSTDTSVSNLYLLRIIDGKTDTDFYPYDFITREEFAKILSETCEVLNIPPSKNSYIYKDQENISDWAVDSVNNMYQSGIMCGNENNEFKPKDNLTKEEAIIAILRLYMSEYPQYIVFKDDGKYGYKDNNGNIVIEPQFAYAENFSEGLAYVQYYYETTEFVKLMGGFINLNGELVIEAYSDTPFKNGMAVAIKHDNDLNLINNPDSEGRFVVYTCQDCTMYYIDRNGKMLFGRYYPRAQLFKEGYACVQIEGFFAPVLGEKNVYTYIDSSGNYVTDMRFDAAFSFENGKAYVIKDGVKGIIDTNFVFTPYEWEI